MEMAIRRYEALRTVAVNGTEYLSLYPEPGEVWHLLRGYAMSSTAQQYNVSLQKDDGTIIGYLRNTVSAVAGKYKWFHVLNDSDAGVPVYAPVSYLVSVPYRERIVMSAATQVIGDTLAMMVIVDAQPLTEGRIIKK